MEEPLLEISISNAANTEPNETLATAASITEGSHTITGGSGVDWFEFEAQAGIMEFTMTATGNPMDLNMILYNSAGQAIQANLGSGATETFSRTGTATETYYLNIQTAQFGANPPANTTMSYTLDIDLPQVIAADGNNTLATATPLAEGSHDILGTGADWHAVVVDNAGEMTLTMTPDQHITDASDPRDDPRDLNMVLYNSAGQAVRAAPTAGAGSESFTYLVSTPGTYYINVTDAQFGAAASDDLILSYDLTVNLPDVAVDDGNNVQAQADVLAEGTHTGLSGTVVDWYRFDTLSGLMSFSMTQSNQPAPGSGSQTPLDLNLELFDAAGNSVRANISANQTESFSFLAGADATYFLKVYWAAYPNGAPAGVQMNYDLTIGLPDATPAEANDTRAGAQTLTPGTQSFTGTGVDWFVFESGPGIMDFTMTQSDQVDAGSGQATPLNLNMELFDSTGMSVRQNFSDTGNTETFDFLAGTTGTYYLKVYWAAFEDGAPNGVTLDYSISMDLPVNTWSVPLDFGPVRNASVATFDIDNDGKDEIFIGTSKALDDQGNEVRPGGLIVLEDDGTVKWTQTFAAHPGPDSRTGKTYNTTSVTTAPTFSDVNGDGKIDILVGIGGDNRQEFNAAGQPGDSGGLVALDADGNVLWSHTTRDTFGGDDETTDGRPDGVYGAPRVFDIDADGVREVLYSAWDQRFYTLNGITGEVEREVHTHDTMGATPALIDVNNDGIFEIIVPSDVTDNGFAGLDTQGGILHVVSNYGQHNVAGWVDQVQNSVDSDYRGKFEVQSLWSTAQVVDLDRDGSSEIVVGTGNFFQDDRGQYTKVWNSDGTLRFELTTVGRTLAEALIADLDGDGSMEIIQATLEGHVYAWDAAGNLVFDAKPVPFNASATDTLPITRSPIAVDIDNADNDLEILLSIGSQLVVLDSDGTQLTNTTQAERAFNTYTGSPVARDIDGDGRLDLITGGTNEAQNQAVIYRWENTTDTVSDTYRTSIYQGNQSLDDIQSFVERFYSTILGREADAGGRNGWTDNLYTGVLAGADVARGFIGSAEFVNRNTSDTEFVDTLYSAFFNRPADAGGSAAWLDLLSNGTSRDDVLNGFIGSQEFANLATSFGIRTDASFGASSDAATITGGIYADVLRGGAGANTIYDQGTSVLEASPDEEDVFGQVYRLYGATLGRTPDAGGFTSWVDNLLAGNVVLSQVIAAFTGSQEFSNTYGTLTDEAFVQLLYQNVLGRAPAQAETDAWLAELAKDGVERTNVVQGFSESVEYQRNTNAGLDNLMRTVQPYWIDVIEGGAGDDTVNGGLGADIYVFRNGQGGNDVIHGFEPWDELQLSGFGFRTPAQAMAAMTQQGANVVFQAGDQTITFLNRALADMSRVKYNLS